jgi:uncharacterized protein YndB with AHSA1/START domain
LSELQLERQLPAGSHEAWSALTDASSLAAWFWPASFATEVTTDVRVGGGFELRAPGAPIDGFGVSGTYLVVDAPHHVDFSWRWHGEDGETAVEIELRERSKTTTLLLRHGGFADDAERDQHIQGWSDCLDRLERYLAGAGS